MKKKLKPAAGRKVRDPKTYAHIPDDGVELPMASYWRRRLRDGDVVQAKPPKKTKE